MMTIACLFIVIVLPIHACKQIERELEARKTEVREEEQRMNGFVTFVGVIGMELLEFTKLPKMKEFLTRTGASSTDDIAKYGIEKEFFASFEENLPLTPRRKAEEWWSTTYSNSRSLPDPTQESDQKALTPWGTPAVPGQAIPSSDSP